MKTKHFIRSLTALCALTAVGSAFAAVGYEVPAAGFVSSMTRDDVSRELGDAKGNGSAASSRIDGDENTGARGPMGSRYSTPTRGQVNDALITHRRDHPGNAASKAGSLYFGD
jgi:hypothetical protein